MKTRHRILSQCFVVGVLGLAFAPRALGADTIVYATSYYNSQIWAANITTQTSMLIDTTPNRPDSLIFDANGNIVYGLLDIGELWRFDGTTNTKLVVGLGHPADLTLEPSKASVLIADYTPGAARILRYVFGQGSATKLAPPPGQGNFGRVDGLAYDNNGRLFAVINENAVYQIDPGDGHTIKKLEGISGTLDGMTFDPVTGALWVSANSNAGVIEIPTDLSGFTSFASGQIPNPDGLASDGDGNIIVASASTGTGYIYQYNISTGSVTRKNPIDGLDDIAPLTGLGAREFGYVEICKQSDPAHPVSGTFDFTATTPFFTSETLHVPVGYCSGPVQVPAADPHGVVTVTETPTLGDLVDDVTAYSYDPQGFRIDELKSWTLPELHADVYVVPGDTELETVATFTNYAAPPGQLKVCKIAGPGVPVNTLFEFDIYTTGPFGQVVSIPAGPADQGGYCQIVGSYLANTPVLVKELLSNDSPYKVSNITVSPADRGSNYTSNSVIVTIGEGITEATFTNIPRGGGGTGCPTCRGH
jgi:sugar lactone lactonase YvrE